MEKLITITEYNWAFWIAGFFALLEFFRWAYGGIEWLCKTFGIETKSMRQKREWNERLTAVENAIKEIRNVSENNVRMFLDHEKKVVSEFKSSTDKIIAEINKLHDKNKANDEADCAMLRDRIASGMRYFSQNKDADGNVHISFADYENLDALFQQYFAKHGNGTFKKIYETEFQKFIIDR